MGAFPGGPKGAPAARQVGAGVGVPGSERARCISRRANPRCTLDAPAGPGEGRGRALGCLETRGSEGFQAGQYVYVYVYKNVSLTASSLESKIEEMKVATDLPEGGVCSVVQVRGGWVR